ncbi:hypothetical protein GCM10011361_02830 [Muriicola marianensis]|uniref:HTH araC/xylS-type domain-containing protein n=1 Tax=Muriicola marianensis TaxID=1324801 RepID=A0ABQ1QRQ3_9FLAO|nr:hypothetical protein GCM10011361_02830 [Muriicola marianensis]
MTSVSNPASSQASKRIALVLESSDYLRLLDAYQLNLFNQKFQNSLAKTIQHGNGSVLRVDDASCRAVFPSATSAIFAAHKIHDDFKYVTPKIIKSNRRLHMALAPLPAGHPSTSSSSVFFEELTLLCEFLRFNFVITREVRKAYRKENKHAEIDEELIYVISEKEKVFFKALMAYVQQSWAKNSFNGEEMAKATGYSLAQCNRKVKKLTGKTPYAFLKEYRLRKALKSLHDSHSQIGKLAREHGFKSGTHFTRSFQEAFGILPSKYAQLSG